MSDELYTGPDRGHFRVIRLLDQAGVQLRPNARIKDAVVFNFLSAMQYAIVGYSIEWWPDGEPAPHADGEGKPYIPHGRPNVSKLYFRTKTSITGKMLHLEDAIINDFLNTKVLADPMTLLSYTQESAEQTADAAQWRVLDGTPFSYANAVHVTRLEATATTPLTITSEGLRFDWRRTTSADETISASVRDYKFERLRDCYGRMREFIESEIANGSIS